MAEPRKNIGKLRGLSLGPPSRPARETEVTPDAQPTTPQAPPPAAPSRSEADLLPPAESATATRPEPTSTAAASDSATASGDNSTPKRRTTRRRARQTDAQEEGIRPAAPRRSQATTVYLPRETRERLDRARSRTRASNIDLILEAIHATWRDVAVELKTPGPKTDPDLDLPLPRRPRRTVAEASTLQLRLSPDEHAGIASLAHRANVSISELVTHCIDRQWPE